MTPEDLVELINRSSQHRFLYHFTDESNLVSIAQKGLLSKTEMEKEGWWPDATGGNALSWDLDKRFGIDQYVSLCFTTNHPMKYLANKDGRLPNPRYLAISPHVLLLEGVKISFGVANSNAAEILSVREAIGKLDIEVIYKRTEWADPQVNARLQFAEKCEVLIPNLVPRGLIVGKI